MKITKSRAILIGLDFGIFFTTFFLLVGAVLALFGAISWWMVLGFFVFDIVLAIINIRLTARS